MIQNFSSLKITLLTAFLLVYGCKKNETSTPIPKTPEGMIWVPKKTFLQGAKETDKYAIPREIQAHEVTFDGFFMDITEVTNAQYNKLLE